MNTKKSTADSKKQALWDYAHSEERVLDIASTHRIPVATLSRWVGECGIIRRRRGRKPADRPPEHIKQVLAYAGIHGFSNAASHFNISRQFVSSAAKRWGIRPPQKTDSSRIYRVVNERICGKETRGTVVSFRLLDRELSLLRKTLPSSVLQSTRSPHKLVRAALLEHLEKSSSRDQTAKVL